MSVANYLLALSAILFIISVAGILVRRNALVTFMCIEMMLNAVNLSLVVVARQLHSIEGQIFVLMVMAVAAAEAAVGLGILVCLFRHKKSVSVDDFTLLRH